MKHFSSFRRWLRLPGTAVVALLGGHSAAAQDITNNGGTISVTNGATLSISGSFTNTGSGTLDLSTGTGNALIVGGDLTNHAGSTIAPGTGSTVTLNGAGGAQQLSLNGSSLNNLTVNNTATAANCRVDVPSNATVTGALTLASGMVKTTPAAVLSLPDGATLVGEAAGQTPPRFVAGNLKATKNGVSGATPTVFPNGVSLTPNANLGTVDVTRTAGLQTAQTSYGTNPANAAQKGIDQIWQFSVAPGAAASVTFAWLSDNDNGLSSFANSRVWARTAAPVAGQSWTPVGAVQNAAGRSITVTGGAFSFWTVSTDAAPLPVELTAFTAERKADAALLRWQTASERDNAYFDVEVSPNGRDFRKLAQVAGQGTKATPTDYALTDLRLLAYAADPVYYRLKQVDLSGAASYSPVRAVRVDDGPVKFGAEAFPNPLGPDGTQVLVRTGQAGPAALAAYDATGRLLFSRLADLAPGANRVDLPEAGQLATGVYYLKVSQNEQHAVLKLTRE